MKIQLLIKLISNKKVINEHHNHYTLYLLIG